jgi:acetylornithine deacetylase/succinyl-diaminopimelate desuccinylase-like protein
LLSRGAELGVDAAIMSDMAMRGPGVPAITYGLRGTLGVELEARAAESDLHSGVFGGAVANPVEALVAVLASLHEADGQIDIEGFYSRVRPPDARERAYLAQYGPSDAEVLANAGRAVGIGESGWSAFERAALRPSMSVNGIAGGYSGEGVKAVIPAKASAKISFRLVPDQDPRQIDELLRVHIARSATPGVHIRVRTAFGARPVLVARRHPVVRAAAAAAEEAFGRAPVFLRSGGTIPVVSAFVKELHIPTVLLGFAMPDDGMHAPNEKFHLPNLFRGIETSIRFLGKLGHMTPPAVRGGAGT